MTLAEYLTVIRRRGWLALVLAAMALVGGLIVAAFQLPLYRSTAYISVLPARSEYGTILSINNLLNNYTLKLATTQNAQAVADKLRLDVPPERLLSRFKVTPQQDNFVLQVDVDYPDPVVAEAIVALWTRNFVEEEMARNADQARQDRIDVSVLDLPEPAQLEQPKLVYLAGVGIPVIAPVGLVLGLMAGLFLGFFLEFLDDTLKGPDDLERDTGLTALGAIPRVK